MIRGNLFIPLFLIFFCLYGCNSRPTDERILNKKVLSEAKVLSLDTIDLKGIERSLAYQYYVYKDSVLIVQNFSRDGQWLIELYDLKTKDLKNKLLRIGRGHNEVLQCTSFVSGDKLIVYDFQLQKLFNIDIDSVLTNKKYMPKYDLIPNGGISSFAYLNDQPVMDNLYIFDSEKVKIHQEGNRLFYCKDYKVGLEKSYKFNTQNITSGGLVIACQYNKKIMYASMHQSTIELYNNMLEMEKAIIGPKELDTDYYIDENNEVIFDRSIPYTYINYYCTSKEVGLLYYGTLVNASNDEFENHNGYLLVFDWEGNLKKNYAIGAHALAVSKSVKYPNTYYCCIRGKDKELYLCKAHE